MNPVHERMPSRECTEPPGLIGQQAMPLPIQVASGKAGRTQLDEVTAKATFWLFAAGAIAGMFQLFFPFDQGSRHEIDFGEGYEMVALARSLAEHGTFANPFSVENTGPTAVEPPLYPLLLAGATAILKQQSLVAIVAVIGNISINALTAPWLSRISLLLFGGMMPGIVAALLWLAAVRLMPSWDTSYTVAGLILFCLFSASAIERKKNTIGFGVLAGVIAGLVFLLNPASVLVSGVWIAYLLTRRKSVKQAAGYCCALFATVFLIAVAWSLRNYYELGALAPRTNLGMTLYASNNDCAESSLTETVKHGCYQDHHPNHNASEASLLRTLGEREYDHQRVSDAKRWITANPSRFLRLTLQRFREFWFPPPADRAYMTYIIWLATALSVPGLILMALRREPVTLFVAAVLLIYPLMYYVVVSDVRYRYPVLWLSLLQAGYLIARIVSNAGRLRSGFLPGV